MVYKVSEWEGEPVESEEMAPKWFAKDQVPYELMWEDDKYWLLLVLDGKKLVADFLFGNGDKLIDFNISEI